MSKSKKDGYEYWSDEVHYGLSDIEGGQIRIGRALWKLHGPKGQKKNQLWKTDPEAEGIIKFTDYCVRKWPEMSWRRAYQFMKAYEDIELQRQDEEADKAQKQIEPMVQSAQDANDLQQDQKEILPLVESALNANDLQEQKAPVMRPGSERVIRPLTKLKTEADRKRAWQIANENAKGKRVTSRHTAEAVKTVQIENVIEYQEAKQTAKEIGHEMRTEKELQQYAEEGISTKDAFLRVHACWTAFVKDEDDERAIDKLARIFIEYLTDKYSIDS